MLKLVKSERDSGQASCCRGNRAESRAQFPGFERVQAGCAAFRIEADSTAGWLGKDLVGDHGLALGGEDFNGG